MCTLFQVPTRLHGDSSNLNSSTAFMHFQWTMKYFCMVSKELAKYNAGCSYISRKHYVMKSDFQTMDITTHWINYYILLGVVHCLSEIRNSATCRMLVLLLPWYIKLRGTRCSVVGWGTMKQAGRSRVSIPMRSLDFTIDLILPAALWPLGRLSL
jgi:hypothetical protein